MTTKTKKLSKAELKEAELKSQRSLERAGFNMGVLRLHLDTEITKALEEDRMTVEQNDIPMMSPRTVNLC